MNCCKLAKCQTEYSCCHIQPTTLAPHANQAISIREISNVRILAWMLHVGGRRFGTGLMMLSRCCPLSPTLRNKQIIYYEPIFDKLFIHGPTGMYCVCMSNVMYVCNMSDCVIMYCCLWSGDYRLDYRWWLIDACRGMHLVSHSVLRLLI